jgi:hypothetical protein
LNHVPDRSPENHPRSDPRPRSDSLSAAISAGDTLAAALAYRALGISTFPVKADGSKEPAFSGWREYAERLPEAAELQRRFRKPGAFGIGIAGGIASGNLAVLDFETRRGFSEWGGRLSADDRSHLTRSPVIASPRGGAHVYVRTAEPVKGCKLARTAAGETLIEIRGSQHYVVGPGSPWTCHPSGRPWRILRPGWLDGGSWEPMPLGVYHSLTVLAADLNEYVRPAAREVIGDRRTAEHGDRPGDHFNARVSWSDLLMPHGWRPFRSSAAVTYWTRPGKAEGVSASTGHCRGPSGNDLFYVFSTSAAPFEAEVSYSRFAVYTLLHHHGDFRAATRALGWAGYGIANRKAVRQ